jgi:CHAT domain-containing protein
VLDERGRSRYHEEAGALLARRTWTPQDVDDAIQLHDALETPDAPPDPVAQQLRARLTLEIQRELAAAENPAYRVRLEIFSSSQLEAAHPLQRRLALLRYQGMANFIGYQTGAHGQIDAAVDAYQELDRTVRAAGPQAASALGEVHQAALTELALSYYLRYDGRRELLQGDLRADLERQIRADLDRAIEASERAAGLSPNPEAQAAALTTVAMGYQYRYEDDQRYAVRETIDTAVARLREALRLAGEAVRQTGGAPAAVYTRRGIRDRLAGALAVSDTQADVDAAIALYLENRDEATSLGLGATPGEANSLATAYIRRWMHTKDHADRARAREAYAEAFAIGAATHLPSAFDIAAQWGGLAWQEKWWTEAGTAYQQATRVMHLAVRQQGSRADREWVVRKAPGVAARAALGLARSGALDDALVTLETGRAVLLTEMFDRRDVDYQRIASLAGDSVADDYQRLTDELTQLEARLLLTGPQGDRAVTVAIEEARKQRSALQARMSGAARGALSELDVPPTVAELRRAAGPATAVYLDTTGEGGLALILRPGGAPVEYLELEDLTVAAAMELVGALDWAVHEDNAEAGTEVAEEICEELWQLAMESLLPRLSDVAEVVLIPGGTLAGLPWHAAKLPGRSAGHVLDRLAVSYMPNVRSLPVARAAWRSMPPSLRVLAVEAPESASASPLRTEQEIAAVQACHGADFRVISLPGPEATKPRLRDALAQFEVLHFAGHAQADPDPLAGGLLLACDELLTIRDLLATGIGAARFAVLSACETARVEDLMSDEMVSFPTALMQCGFGGVVGSLWVARDMPTTRLMKAFYREWRGKSASPRQALRAAVQANRDRYASPLAWANFVYIGP